MARYALIVGVSYENHDQLNELNFAFDDAVQVRDFLHSTGYEPYQLYDLRASNQRIRNTLKEIRKKLKCGDTFVFYFSGHGYETGSRQYLLPADADIWTIEHGGGTAIPVDFIERATAVDGVERILIIDACRKSIARDKSMSDDRGGFSEKGISNAVRTASTESSIGILCSCKKGFVASEFSNLKGSVFTKALLDVFKCKRLHGEEIALPGIFDLIQNKVFELHEKYCPFPYRQRPYFRGDSVVLLPASCGTQHLLLDNLERADVTAEKLVTPRIACKERMKRETQEKKKREEIIEELRAQKMHLNELQKLNLSGREEESVLLDDIIGMPFPEIDFSPLIDDLAQKSDGAVKHFLSFGLSSEQREVKRRADKMLESVLSRHLLWLDSGQGKENRLIWENLEPVITMYKQAGLGAPDFANKNMTKADFSNCKFADGVNFSGANLASASFKSSFLTNVRFSECNLDGSNFSNSTLNYCDFSNATLRFALFVSASVNKCQFEEADIGGIKVDKALLDPPNLGLKVYFPFARKK